MILRNQSKKKTSQASTCKIQRFSGGNALRSSVSASEPAQRSGKENISKLVCERKKTAAVPEIAICK